MREPSLLRVQLRVSVLLVTPWESVTVSWRVTVPPSRVHVVVTVEPSRRLCVHERDCDCCESPCFLDEAVEDESCDDDVGFWLEVSLPWVEVDVEGEDCVGDSWLGDEVSPVLDGDEDSEPVDVGVESPVDEVTGSSELGMESTEGNELVLSDEDGEGSGWDDVEVEPLSDAAPFFLPCWRRVNCSCCCGVSISLKIFIWVSRMAAISSRRSSALRLLSFMTSWMRSRASCCSSRNSLCCCGDNCRACARRVKPPSPASAPSARAPADRSSAAPIHSTTISSANPRHMRMMLLLHCEHKPSLHEPCLLHLDTSIPDL